MTLFIVVPLLAKDLGINYAHLGIIGFAYGISAFLSNYYFGRISDKFAKRKIFLLGGFALSAIFFYLHALAKNWLDLVALRILSGIAVGMFSFPLVAYTHDMLGNKGVGIVSAFSSLGWAFGGILITITQDIILACKITFFLFLLATLIALSLKDSKVKPLSIPLFPIKLIRKNAYLYTLYFIRHVGACSVWIIFPIYLMLLGANFKILGILYALNPVVQTIAMLIISRIDARSVLLIRWGIVFSLITFLIYAISTTYHTIFVGQLTLGVGWACLYLGSLLYLLNRNVEKATSTGLLGSTISMAQTLGSFIGGVLAMQSIKMPMVFACISCIISFFLSLKL